MSLSVPLWKPFKIFTSYRMQPSDFLSEDTILMVFLPLTIWTFTMFGGQLARHTRKYFHFPSSAWLSSLNYLDLIALYYLIGLWLMCNVFRIETVDLHEGQGELFSLCRQNLYGMAFSFFYLFVIVLWWWSWGGAVSNWRLGEPESGTVLTMS